MDSDRLLSCHDYADATGVSGLRRAVILTLTGIQLTFGQWQQTTAPGTLGRWASGIAQSAPGQLPTAPELVATPPSRPRRRRTPTASAATTGAPA